MAFVDRYTQDQSAPRFGAALRDAFVRAALPGVLVWVAIVGFGLMLKGPLAGLSAREESVSTSLAKSRTTAWDTITFWWSHIGNTEIIIAVCFIVVALVWWRTRQWWFAAVPAIAIALQATIFVLAAWVVARPRPHVQPLDPAPPTSSYPSGHVGAATALYLTFALMAATRIQRPALRWLALIVSIAAPVLVAYGRLYRGMHHVTDIGVGVANGVVCALLAWNYLRRSDTASTGQGGQRTLRTGVADTSV
jgi:membrane-associated phospholipid phosphatase